MRRSPPFLLPQFCAFSFVPSHLARSLTDALFVPVHHVLHAPFCCPGRCCARSSCECRRVPYHSFLQRVSPQPFFGFMPYTADRRRPVQVWLWDGEYRRVWVCYCWSAYECVQPTLLANGEVLSTGEDYTSDGAFSAGIAYVLSVRQCVSTSTHSRPASQLPAKWRPVWLQRRGLHADGNDHGQPNLHRVRLVRRYIPYRPVSAYANVSHSA